MNEKPLLSILVPGVPPRLAMGAALVEELQQQVNRANLGKTVEIIWLIDNYQRTIGGKRQALVELARGEYIIFCDDDDKVAPNYIEKIVDGCRKGVDVVTFCQSVDWNGTTGFIEFHLHNRHDFWHGRGDVHQRKPWHVCAWKRSIAIQCTFPDLNWAEDVPWVEAADVLGQTEYHIPEVLHIYSHYDKTSASSIRLAADRK